VKNANASIILLAETKKLLRKSLSFRSFVSGAEKTQSTKNLRSKCGCPDISRDPDRGRDRKNTVHKESKK